MSAPYLQDNARSPYLASSSGKAAGCAATSVPGAMAPVTDHPPEGYTRYRAPSAPDERLSRTRGSPDQRRPGDMGHDARRPVGQCGERVISSSGGYGGAAAGPCEPLDAAPVACHALSRSHDVLDHEVTRGRWFRDR